MKSDQLDSIFITLSGDAANIPSISNSREIGYKWSRDRTTRRLKKIPFIKKTASQIAAMKELSDLFGWACIQSGYGLPTFGAEEVHILALLAHKPGRWDSHNAAKALGDWAQSAGIVIDDSACEIDIRKKSEYQPFFENLNTTEIIISRRDLIFSLSIGFVHAIKEIHCRAN